MRGDDSQHINDIRKILDDLGETSQRNFRNLESLVNSLRLSETVLEERNRAWILDKLYFDSMDARRESVDNAETNTFQWWIDSDHITNYNDCTYEVTFKDWLASGREELLPNPFHIVGKPGSGKSTLMKLIDKAIRPDSNQASRIQLKKWANGNQLITATFYAWKAGNRYQRSFQGLIRTLLHSILEQSPVLTGMAFPSRWKPGDFAPGRQRDLRSSEIPFDEILEAFNRIRSGQGQAKDMRFFFLIDGLDELEDYNGCPNGSTGFGVAELIWSWVRQENVKACVSSREQNPFMNTFPAELRLRLHMITYKDVETLVENRLMPRLRKNFPSTPQEHLQKLTRSVVEKAEGVFLWVILTIIELWHGLDD
ncbi:hypothetical protein M406DRAFT_249289, partial [Cryphonectria parasitica EP155]